MRAWAEVACVAKAEAPGDDPNVQRVPMTAMASIVRGCLFIVFVLLQGGEQGRLQARYRLRTQYGNKSSQNDFARLDSHAVGTRLHVAGKG